MCYLAFNHSRSTLPVLLIFVFLASVTTARAQLSVGEYADVVVATDSHAGTPNYGCASLNVGFIDITPFVVGMELVLSIDSLSGTSDSLALWHYPDYQQDPIYPGDLIPIQTGYGSTELSFYFFNYDTVYYSIHAIGTPLVAGQTYDCGLDFHPTLLPDGCYEKSGTYSTDDDDCVVAEGGYELTNDSCTAAAVLEPGLNWVNTTGATGDPDLNIPCWNEGEETTEQSGVWYEFTTTSGPNEIDLSFHPNYTDLYGMSAPQMALFLECGSAPIACSSPGADSSASIHLDCAEVLPNTTYYLLVEGSAGEEGLAALAYYPNEGCADTGCTDPEACNYDPSADIDDGSCLYGVDCWPGLNIEAVHCNSFTVDFITFPNTGGQWLLTLNAEFYSGFNQPELNDELSDLPPGNYELCYWFISPVYIGDTLVNSLCTQFTVDESCICDFEIDAVADSTADNMLDLILSFDPDEALELQWDFGDGTTGTGPYPSHDYADEGPYQLCLTAVFPFQDTSTCAATSCILLSGSMTGEDGPFSFSLANPTGLEDINDSRISRIWPNPARDVLNIETDPSHLNDRLSIYSITGRLIAEIDLTGRGHSDQIDIESLAPGMYVLQLTLDDGSVETHKIEVMR